MPSATSTSLSLTTGTTKHDRSGETRVRQAGGVHRYCPKEEKQMGLRQRIRRKDALVASWQPESR